jgi:hypothetical protein
MITEEIEQQELDICRKTAIRLMKGTRYGSDRPVRMARILTKEKGETDSFFQRIRDCGHWQLSLIKILDRIANLGEGSQVFPRKRWIAYVEETKQHVVPLIANIDANLCERLLLELGYAMVDRPTGGRTG